jgi:AraC family transcriptional regulator
MMPEIRTLKEMQLIGKRLHMSFANNRTPELWRSFMPRLQEIRNRVRKELYSAEVYPANFFQDYNVNNEFDKWAAVEVADKNVIPNGMEPLVFPSGLYAVFIHKGTPEKGAETYRYIFMDWMPGSGYEVDSRPHFAVMGDKYKHNDESSEEEIWIPIKPKAN